jgi:hypothetical protein
MVVIKYLYTQILLGLTYPRTCMIVPPMIAKKELKRNGDDQNQNFQPQRIPADPSDGSLLLPRAFFIVARNVRAS